VESPPDVDIDLPEVKPDATVLLIKRAKNTIKHSSLYDNLSTFDRVVTVILRYN